MTTKFFSSKNSALRRRTRYVQGGVSEMKGANLTWWERDTSLFQIAADDEYINGLPLVYEGKPWLLAFDLYGDEGLEWIILQCNNIVDINEEFVAGAILRVPSKRRVFQNIIIKTVNYINVISD